MLESALIVPVPEAEPVVRAWRDQHDPSARLGVPAHITVLYPFAAPEIARAEADTLAALFRRVAAFAFSLVDVRSFPKTAYLAPDPGDRFVALTQAVAGRWPAYPPYGAAFADIVPHLTVADGVGADVLAAAARALQRELPIRCHAAECWLLCRGADGHWVKERSFTFEGTGKP